MAEGKKGPSFAMNLLGILILLFIAFLFVSLFGNINPSRELAYRAICATNLNGIGKSIALYRDVYNECSPPCLGQLDDEGFASKRMFICPGYSRILAQHENYNDIDYVLVISDIYQGNIDILQVFELPINHYQEQANYLLCGGRINKAIEKNFDGFIISIQDANNLLAKLRNNP